MCSVSVTVAQTAKRLDALLPPPPPPPQLHSVGQCMENCTCTKSKCFCTDKDQTPWPAGGTAASPSGEFEKQLKKAAKRNKGHVKKNKDGHCACSCDKKGF